MENLFEDFCRYRPQLPRRGCDNANIRLSFNGQNIFYFMDKHVFLNMDNREKEAKDIPALATNKRLNN